MLTRFQTTLHAVLSLLATLVMVLSGVALVVLITTFGWLVFGRYALNQTPTWVEQLALLLIVFITFTASAVGVRDRTHLAVDLLFEYVSRPTRRVILTVVHLLLAGFGLLMAVHSTTLMTFAWGTEIPLLGVSEGLRVLPMVIGGILTTAFALGNIVDDWVAQTTVSASAGHDSDAVSLPRSAAAETEDDLPDAVAAVTSPLPSPQAQA
ncbi:TRAP transporter small permease [Novispirillum itersonii]|uniref:TRAP transporter small permease protein n=1 Tax=Novispirillum itersonii TaxID=189 RepID=A0A7X0DMR6_NOVIT|nr:TRAP transporter small permease [Novispirillum itersonii]MBB6211336.1 TRAP-type C4-dicarboxylate transport system permease small subunit [Novispirillum itersonii]